MRCGPLRQDWLCAVGHCGVFGYTIWLDAMGHCSGFGYVLWASGWNEAVQ
jgi:hypothetical protein